MKISKTFASIGILLSMILIAGCLGSDSSSGSAGYGQDSLDLSIDTEGRTTFDSKETFIITMTSENVGPFDITDVKTRLVGYGGISKVGGGSLSTKESMADTLDRPRPDLDLVGGSATWDWDVNAPTVSVDAPDVDIRLTGEVFYTTKSLAVQKVVVANKDYVIQLEERGEVVPVNPATEALNGPVSIDVEVADPYILTQGTTPSFRVKLALNNDGSGNVFATTIPGKERDWIEKVTMTVPIGLTVDNDNCDFDVVIPAENIATAEKTLTLDENSVAEKLAKLRLMEGGLKRDIACRLFVDKTQVTGYQTFELYAQTDYTYLQDIVRDLVVQGAETD